MFMRERVPLGVGRIGNAPEIDSLSSIYVPIREKKGQ
jgi:hypothetical protein